MSAAHRSTRVISLIATLVLAIGLLVVAPSSAFANHGNLTLDVEPETARRIQGEEHTMTATVSQTVVACPEPATGGYGGCGSVNIDFENEGGRNDPDAGASHTTPDLTCTIEVGFRSCQVSYFGTTSTGGSTSSETWRAWIDHDKNDASTEADLNEGQSESLFPGTGCLDRPATQDPTKEPDCTDVVRATFLAPDRTPTTLDCDDERGSDEKTQDREVNAVGESETYTCAVLDQRGNAMAGQQVNGENENGINDRDLQDGPSYESPDYTCTTAFPEPTQELPPFCQITVSSVESEEGTAHICFWVDTDQNTSTNEGTSLCQTLGEPIDEPQHNDLADSVQKRWVRASRPSRLNCEPETDSNPVGTSHTITCTVQNQGTETNTTPSIPQGGIEVDVEATGVNDPDNSNTPETPDFTCTTAGDQSAATPPVPNEGTCTFTHGPGGTGTTGQTGQTLYRAWVDYDKDDSTRPEQFVDDQEGRNEREQPGTHPEVDETDVVEKNWILAPATLQMTPESDSAPVGTCNAFTVTVRDAQNAPVEGAIIDVEQRHTRSTNNTNNDEPTVGFCEPAREDGPNPSNVDETRGDLRPPAEEPDNKGTAGGETEKATDANGQITFGITVTPGNGSDGTGSVEVVAFYDEADAQGRENDDPDAREAQDRSTKFWTPPPQGRTIDCDPKTDSNPVGTDHVVTCTVRDANGKPVEGEGVTFTETGPGEFVGESQTTSDKNGQATATVRSESESGTQTITGTLTDDTQGAEPGEVDECDRPAGSPSGSPAGKCSDSVSKTWTGGTAPDCSDGVDNDNDGATDHPADDGCSSPEDETEEPDGAIVAKGPCAGFEEGSRQPQSGGGEIIVGTQGPDDLTGTDGDDLICGLGGRDSIRGLDGDDRMYGGGSHDNIRGTSGNDRMYGGRGLDVLRGGSGNDLAKGQGQDDTIRGYTGKDRLIGGGADDTIRAGDGDDYLAGNAGDDILAGAAGRDTCRGGSGKDITSSCER